uniref:S-acyltransferase n=1 Tax=Elaeis guineensis var. tenera TaxID=51953 RepID=A0A6J0PQT0_ELAGV|nr:probable protein S-acyltransferase 22 isoform X2 [Elaeis guineensis]
MRKHGWQLPYHPLQVTCVFFLYVWCAATNPADPGLFKSKKCLQLEGNAKQTQPKEFRGGGPENEANAATTGDKRADETINKEAIDGKSSDRLQKESLSCCNPFLAVFLSWCPLLCDQSHSREQSSEQQMSEEGMFYCSLCKVEVLKYSKHCRVCDKCVDGFDHHCRWLNNCIGRRNYRRFFILMVSALLLLILQWSIGILVLILCFLERKRFSVEIISKLGSSFSLVPFVVVVASCTFLAMIATLPLAQLFFFHILLIKKGISTYDYIIALREQEQQEQQGVGGQQSPQMSSVSSLTGLSSASSFSAFHRGAWCTPPRLFLEDQFDVVPPEIGTSVNPMGKKMMVEESTRKKSAGTVKISPWTLARLNADEVSKAAAEARKRSKVLQPIARRDLPLEQERDNSFGSGSGRIVPRPDNRRRQNKRGRFPVDLPLEPLAKISASTTDSNGTDLAPDTSSSLAPLQLEARSAFRPSRPAPSTKIIASSPDSSLDSPDLHPFRISSSGAEEVQGLTTNPASGTVSQKGIQLSRSTSDGYEASGGEDSDRIPSRIVHRSSNWSNLVLNPGRGEMAADFKTASASLQSYVRPL